MTSYVAIVNTPGYLPDTADELPVFDTAREAWYALYHDRCDYERDYETESGICSSCGEMPDDWQDHDADTEESAALAKLARADKPGCIILPGIAGHGADIAYTVEEIR